jgi:DNA-binding transcriptional ArsR family regulator
VTAAGGGDAEGVFDALGDPTRRAVLGAVATAGPVTATELARRFPVSRQAVVKHLGALAGAGLVAPERAGREVRYHLVPAPLDDAATWLRHVGGAWDDRIERLRAHLDPGPSADGST